MNRHEMIILFLIISINEIELGIITYTRSFNFYFIWFTSEWLRPLRLTKRFRRLFHML
jgi:hypothetical protein